MEKKHFKKKNIFIHFDAADPAGLLFFAHYFKLAHRLIEKSLSEAQIHWKDWFSNPHWGAPIRSAKADYLKPLFPGNTYESQVLLTNLKKSSLAFEVHFFNQSLLCTKVFITFVFLNLKTKKVIKIPETFKKKLSPYQSEENPN